MERSSTYSWSSLKVMLLVWTYSKYFYFSRRPRSSKASRVLSLPSAYSEQRDIISLTYFDPIEDACWFLLPPLDMILIVPFSKWGFASLPVLSSPLCTSYLCCLMLIERRLSPPASSPVVCCCVSPCGKLGDSSWVLFRDFEGEDNVLCYDRSSYPPRAELSFCALPVCTGYYSSWF